MADLILGGARSGKSRIAEQLAQQYAHTHHLQLSYIATAAAGDGEMQERIALHQQQRGDSWQLIEEPLQLSVALQQHCTAQSCVLVDCLTLWLSNCLIESVDRYQQERDLLLKVLPVLPGKLIFVSNETGLGVVPMGQLTRQFVDEAGRLHQHLAAECDRVVFTVAGLPQILKGEPLA